MGFFATFNTASVRDYSDIKRSEPPVPVSNALIITAFIDSTTGNTLGINHTGGNYSINWGDGTSNNNVVANVTHQYSYSGIYHISLTGNVGVTFDTGPLVNTDQIRDIKSWGNGNVVISNASGMFAGARQLDSVITATDSPVFGANCNASGMFFTTEFFNTPIDNWDTGNITDMSYMFYNTQSFNQSIDNWNTGNVTDMNNMFRGAGAFNQPIGNWNTGNVTNMSVMLADTPVFNQSIGNWNTGNVTDMNGMFANANTFNQPIGNWNTGNVTRMAEMFRNAKAFNQPIDNWNTGNVTIMGGMFRDASAFNQSIGNWNTGNVANMNLMFFSSIKFNQNLSSWCVTNIPTKPVNFDAGATSWTLPNSRPIWGTCPP